MTFRPSYEGWKLRFGQQPLQRHDQLLDLPMRDGNCCIKGITRENKRLLDLPMRDGNLPLMIMLSPSSCPFRPSYEGWKLHLASRKALLLLLLDLPMRDGNYDVRIAWIVSPFF